MTLLAVLMIGVALPPSIAALGVFEGLSMLTLSIYRCPVGNRARHRPDAASRRHRAADRLHCLAWLLRSAQISGSISLFRLMNISVIVPAYQAAAVLPQCLSALQQQSIDRSQYEIIVVDDGSTDGTADAGRTGAARLSHRAGHSRRAWRPGPVRAIWARRPRRAICCCSPMPIANRCPTGSNSLPASSAIRRSAAPRARMPRGSARSWRASCSRNMRSVTIARAPPGDDRFHRHVFGRLSARRSSWTMAALMPSAFPTASVEDQEFSFRLAARGLSTGLRAGSPGISSAQHHAQRAISGASTTSATGRCTCCKRHPGKAVRDSHTPQMVKVQIVLLAAALIEHARRAAAADRAADRDRVVDRLRLSMLPLLIKIARRDPPVLLIAPLMIFVRTLALGLGLFVGAAALLRLSSRSTAT